MELNSKCFSRISEIRSDRAETYAPAFLTIDIDWANDGVINDTIDLVEQADVEATWFVTHQTSVLDRLRGNPKFELGIHPNFNFLLNGDQRNGRSIEDVIDRLLSIVPEARSVRSHSMTQSSNIIQLFVNKGLTHECNHFIPSHAKMELKPWTLWNGMVKVPHFWEDDAECLYGSGLSIAEPMSRRGIRVFDFHPIHVFLNTESLVRYEKSRAIHQDCKELIRHRYLGYGTRSALKSLLRLD